jgi:putative ABC transport system permease protein
MSGQQAPSDAAKDWRSAWTIARRELRDGLGRGLAGFRIFIACLALGVAAIAAVGATRTAVEDGIARDAQRLAGSDLEARLLYREANQEQQDYIKSLGRFTRIAEMRSMALVGERRQLASLKAVDGGYPLYGGLTLSPDIPAEQALAQADGAFGAAVEQAFLDATGLKVGDQFRLNKTNLIVRAIITEEADRGVGLLSLGPRVLVSHEALDAAGLAVQGALVTWRYRVALPPGQSADAARDALKAAFDDPGWRLRTAAEAAPTLRRMIERLSLFLTLASLAALLVGGVGAANAVKAYMDGRARTAAILKCLGAPAHVIFRAYLMQIALIAAFASILGAVIGGLTPMALTGLLADILGVRLAATPAFASMGLAALFGLVTAFVFALWPLAAAERLPAARLIGAAALGISGIRPARGRLWLLALGAIALAALAVLTAADKMVAAAFVAGALMATLLFLGCATLLIRAAHRMPRRGGPLFRLAMSGIARPGAPTLSIALSLGLGLAALTAVTMTEAAFSSRLDRTVATKAPTFFFIDIQPQQLEPFRAILKDLPGVTLDGEAPMLRARITHINGVPAAEAAITDDTRWAIRNERGLTFAAEPPAATPIVAGEWWPADYQGKPLVSFDAAIAKGFGIGLGDTLTFNVLGRAITAEIASLRQLDYSSFAMNFSTILDPATLKPAPHTILATASATPEMEAETTRRVTDALPNVTVIRVKDAVVIARRILDRVGGALAAVAAMSVIAGALTLAGAVAASQRRRVYEAALLKTAGATRAQIIIAQGIEFALIGLVTAMLAVGIGALGAWAIVTFLLQTDFVFSVPAAAIPAGLALALAVSTGAFGVWRALRLPAGPMLRNA